MPQHKVYFAGSLAEAANQLKEDVFDLTIVDLHLPKLLQASQLERLCKTRSAGKFAILSSDYYSIFGSRKFEGCLVGYWPKTINLETLVAYIESIEAGERCICHESAWPSKHKCAGFDSLGEMEITVLRLLALGAKLEDIAAELGVSTGIANETIRGIYRKMGVSNKVAACVAAYDAALL